MFKNEMKTEKKTPRKMAFTYKITSEEGFDDPQFSFLGHIHGLLKDLFGQKQVSEEREFAPISETGLLDHGKFTALKDDINALLREKNENAGVRYSLKDVDHVSFEFISDNEGGKIKMSVYSKWQEGIEGPLLTSTFSAVWVRLDIAGSALR